MLREILQVEFLVCLRKCPVLQESSLPLLHFFFPAPIQSFLSLSTPATVSSHFELLWQYFVYDHVTLLS